MRVIALPLLLSLIFSTVKTNTLSYTRCRNKQADTITESSSHTMGLRRIRPVNGGVIVGRGSRTDKDRAVTRANLLFHDKTISKEHALIRLELEDGIEKVTIVDTGSRHGVVVSGRMLEPWVAKELKSDDWIGLVSTSTRLEVEEDHCKCILDFCGVEDGVLLFNVIKPDTAVGSEEAEETTEEAEGLASINEYDDEQTLLDTPSLKRALEEDAEKEAPLKKPRQVRQGELDKFVPTGSDIKPRIVSGLVGLAVGATLGAGLTFSTLLSVGRSLS